MPAFLIKNAGNQPFVFIHNPKTGGQSLRHTLLQGDFEGPVVGPLPRAWNQWFKFAMVRNPFDRLVSAWKMFSQGINDTGWKVPLDLKPGMSLVEFLEIVVEQGSGFTDIHSESNSDRKLSGKARIRNHTLPQTHAFYGIQQADFIGRFESFNRDVKQIFQRLDLSYQLPAPRHRTKRGPYQQYFDATTRAITASYYAEDLRVFGYSFQQDSQNSGY